MSQNENTAHALRLGERLCKAGYLQPSQLQQALDDQQNSRLPFAETLLKLKLLQEDLLYPILAQQLNVRFLEVSALAVDTQALRLIENALWEAWVALPVSQRVEPRRVAVAMSRPNDAAQRAAIQQHLPADCTLHTYLAAPTAILAALHRHFQKNGTFNALDRLDRPLTLAAKEEGSTAIRAVDAILLESVERSASDVHFEPEAACVRVRYRIDGVLKTIWRLAIAQWSSLLIRIKVLARLNLAETRVPQDGRFSVQANGRLIDCRVSTLPTFHGENVVIRLLDRSNRLKPLNQLGLAAETLHTLMQLLDRAAGLFLVTGPTGSGKTSTLYSILLHLAHDGVNVMTLEDPVEYPLVGIRQTQIDEAVRLDFSTGVRAILRQDPDILLIGEIRDSATAAMALRAAMSGQRVLATVHAASALHAPARLSELGVATSLLFSHLTGVLAQRLLRRVCSACAEFGPPTPQIAQALLSERLCAAQVAYAKSCSYCHQTGYNGRFMIGEIYAFEAEASAPPWKGAERVSDFALIRPKAGWKSLWHHALAAVVQGTSTFDEVRRVVDCPAAVETLR